MKTLKIIMVGLIIGLKIYSFELAKNLEGDVWTVGSNQYRNKDISIIKQNPNVVKVAIIDSGCNITYKEAISFIDGTIKDYNGHGTLMARIIKEVFPESELYIIKVIGKDGFIISEETLIFALEWAILKEVNIINMSLKIENSKKLHNVIKKAYKKGIIIVAAAGNSTSFRESLYNALVSESLQLHFSYTGLITEILNTKYEIQYAVIRDINYPAKYNEVISVGALDRYGKVYEGSVKGGKVDFFCKGYKDKKAGTSIASAYVTGIVARIISKHPTYNIDEIKHTLKNILKKKNKI